MNLYGRVARLTLYRPRGSSYFDLTPNGVEIVARADAPGQRIQFSIEKRLGSAPDTCTVTVTNLNADSRADFENYPLAIQLDAGHDGEFRRIFAGDMRWASSSKKSTDWETLIQVADGARAYRHARVGRSFKEGVTVKTALAEVAKSMGLRLPRELEVSKELDAQFGAGLVLDGLSRDELSRLLAPYGYEWQIQDGTLTVYRDDQARPGQALVVSPATGLIESPEFTPPTTSGKKSKSIRRSTLRSPRLNFRTLLYPQIVPGCKVFVDSVITRGIYKVIQVTHTGDTHGDEWTTAVEAKPL